MEWRGVRGWRYQSVPVEEMYSRDVQVKLIKELV
jgi:hypothetical protein